MSAIQKVEVSAAADSSELRELILAQARLVQLSKEDMLDKSHQFTVDGLSLALRTTDTVLAVSRRDGGLSHFLAFYSVSGYRVGIIFIQADETLIAVCFDPADGTTKDLIAATRSLDALQLILTGQQAAWRLMRIPADTILQSMYLATDNDSSSDAAAFFASAASVIQKLVAGRIGEELGIDFRQYKRLEVHYLVPRVEENAEVLEDLFNQATLQ